jgi:acyl carrier protein
MNTPQNKEVEDTVLENLEDILQVPKSQIRRTDRLLKDLKMDGDDFSFLFVPALERTLEVRFPSEVWSTIYTVQDVIDLAMKYLVLKARGKTG